VIMAIVTTMATAPMLNWLEITPGVISGTAARK